MSDAPAATSARFRRFMRFQILLHWCVALPYMFLLGTGASLLLHRLGLATWLPAHAVARMHRWTGIGMAVLIVELLLAALVGGHWRTVGRDLLRWIALVPRDLAWLAKVPLNAFFPRAFPLPPAGRFNAGQKLHGLFILTAVTGFIATGLMMVFRPAWLRPWMIHTWLFFGAVGFLSLHLFLGLINPVTRRALGGIFTGHVPLDYVRAHHALEAQDGAIAATPLTPAHHPPVVSWKAMLLVGLLIGAAASLWWYRGGGREAVARSPTLGREHGMIMPGMLIAAHADAAGAQRCEACHVGMDPPKDRACLVCHSEIAEVMRDGVGYHGQLTGTCTSCHGDHKGRDADLRPLDRRTFNHQLARFSLEGAHQTLNCDRCHVGDSRKPGEVQFVGLETSAGCIQCHADPHQGQFRQQACTSCHNEQGWTAKHLLFVHNRDSTFSLKGKHERITCADCHKPPPAAAQVTLAHATFKGLGTSCQSCHTDPHAGQFHLDCTACHTEQGWTGRQLLFTHERDDRFHLTGKHAALECRQCHSPPDAKGSLAHAQFASLNTDCSQCHADPHDRQFSQSCTACHSESGWTGRQLLFSHKTDTKFPLRGKHAELQCRQCHAPPDARASLAHAPFAKVSTDCRQCHTDPHRGQFQQSCSACHTEQGWKGRDLLFDHNRDSRFKIDALHRDVACSSCHKKEEGRQVFTSLSTSCEQCHKNLTQLMAGQIGSERAPADPHSGRVACVACHEPSIRSPAAGQYADACERCHTPLYRDLLFNWERSLDEHETAARRSILLLKANKPEQAEALSRQVGEARRTGIHNVQAVVTQLDGIVAVHAPSTPNPGPTTRPASRPFQP
jgi:cytochrome b subunit of formate dehydrogenase